MFKLLPQHQIQDKLQLPSDMMFIHVDGDVKPEEINEGSVLGEAQKMSQVP